MKLYYENLEELELKGVYLIRNLENNLLKIGYCNNLKRRYKEIVKSFNFVGHNPNLKIECFIENENYKEMEEFLHDKFSKYNVLNEWFNISDINIITNKINKFILKDKDNNYINSRKAKKITIFNNDVYYNFHQKFWGDMYRVVIKSNYRLNTAVSKINDKLFKSGSKYSILNCNLATYDCNVKEDREYFKELYLNYKLPITKDIMEQFNILDTDCIIFYNGKWIDFIKFAENKIITQDRLIELTNRIEEIKKEIKSIVNVINN